MSLINSIIPLRNFEILKFKIFEILKIELGNQYNLGAFPYLSSPINIEIGRRNPVEPHELPLINIKIEQSTIISASPVFHDAEYSIAIDVHDHGVNSDGVSGFSSSGENGDNRVDRINGMIEFVLKNDAYSTLGFSDKKTFLSAKHEGFTKRDSMRLYDLEDSIASRTTIKVRLREDYNLPTSSCTDVKSSVSENNVNSKKILYETTDSN